MKMTIRDVKFDARTCLRESDIRPSGIVLRNPTRQNLYSCAIQLGQATVMDNGALLQHTAPYFGRAAKNSFYVRDPDATYQGKRIEDLINWGDPSKGEFDNRALPNASPIFHNNIWPNIRCRMNIGILANSRCWMDAGFCIKLICKQMAYFGKV